MVNRTGREYPAASAATWLTFLLSRPSCMDTIKRNWHEFSLSLRFGAHRTKKKLQRKVQNAR